MSVYLHIFVTVLEEVQEFSRNSAPFLWSLTFGQNGSNDIDTGFTNSPSGFGTLCLEQWQYLRLKKFVGYPVTDQTQAGYGFLFHPNTFARGSRKYFLVYQFLDELRWLGL